MVRVQVALSEAHRALLDAESARTGLPLSALIRSAVEAVYGGARSAEDDIETMRTAFGSWADRGERSTDMVDRLRCGTRHCL